MKGSYSAHWIPARSQQSGPISPLISLQPIASYVPINLSLAVLQLTYIRGSLQQPINLPVHL